MPLSTMALYLRGRGRVDGVPAGVKNFSDADGALHIRHTDEVVDLRDAEPVQDVGHQGLKARVLNTGNTLSAVEIPAETRVSRVDGVKYDTALLLFGLVAALLAFPHVIN